MIIIGGAVGIGLYFNHEDSTESVPGAIGGKADEGSIPPQAAATQATLSSSLHVSPTNTVAKRDEVVLPTPELILHQVPSFSHGGSQLRRRHRARI